jgi:hypothetical protein
MWSKVREQITLQTSEDAWHNWLDMEDTDDNEMLTADVLRAEGEESLKCLTDKEEHGRNGKNLKVEDRSGRICVRISHRGGIHTTVESV